MGKRQDYQPPLVREFRSSADVPPAAKRDLEQTRATGKLAVVLDNAGRYTWVSEAFAKQLGYRPEDLIGKRMEEITAPDTIDIDFAFRVLNQMGEMEGLWMLVDRRGKRILVRYHARLSHQQIDAECEPILLAG